MPSTVNSSRPLVTALAVAGLVLVSLGAWKAGASAGNRPVVSAPPTAVATVDLVRVLNGLDEKAAREAELEQSIRARQAQLDELARRLESLRGDLEVLREDSAEYREKVIAFRETELLARARREMLQQIISLQKGTVLGQIYNRIRSGVEKIAEREGYDLVIIDDSGFALPAEAPEQDMERLIISRTVIYSRDSVDITNAVVTLLNNEFSAGSR